MFFELRLYQLQPGKRDEWVKWMDEVLIPYQTSKGMVIVGSFVDEENDKYVWIRRFENEEQKDQLYQAVYDNDYWKYEVRPIVYQFIEKDGIEVKILHATPRSSIQ